MAKILVIDDSPLFRLLLKEILIHAGNECFDAATVTEGLALFFKEEPDLVIKDLIIGDDPVEVIKEFKVQSAGEDCGLQHRDAEKLITKQKLSSDFNQTFPYR